MPQVPYRPYPQVNIATPGEQIHIDTPGAAFGENIGRATEQAGGALEKAGGEIFDRAVAIKHLGNETEARDSVTQYAVAQGQLHADYLANNPGISAKTNLPKFLQDSDELRQKFRKNLTNPDSQRMYDAESQSFFVRNVNSASLHAGEAFKNGVIESNKASRQLYSNSIMSSPDDDISFQRGLDYSIQSAANESAARGFSPGDPQWELNKRNAISSVWAHRIQGYSIEGKTEQAQSLLNTAKAKGLLTDTDLLRLEPAVVHQDEAIQSKNIASKVVNDDPDLNLTQAGDKAYRDFMDASDGDTRGAHMARVAAESEWRQRVYTARIQRDQVHQDLIPFFEKIQPRNNQELLADPEARKLINSLDKKGQNEVTNWIRSFWAAKNGLDHQANHDAFEKLKGEAISNSASFMDRDPNFPEVGAAGEYRTELQRMRAAIVKGQNQNPQVWRAVSWIRGAKGGTMEALGVARLDKNNPTPYYRFTGDLSAALDEFQQANKRPATYQDVVKEGGIADQVLNSHLEGGFTIFGHKFFQSQKADKGAFNFDIPDNVMKEIKQEELDKGNAEPTEDQIYQKYFQTYYHKLFGGSVGGSTNKPAK